MTMSKNLRLLRERCGMTQSEFGKMAGVSDKAVSAWENGLSEPRMGAIQKIADYFGVKKSDIIEEDDNRIYTIAAHHDSEIWTDEELEEIERFKEYVLSKRNK